MISALPKVAITVILVEFVLVDELPAARVRRLKIGVGVFLLLLTAPVVFRMPPLEPVPNLLVASGPPAFLLISELLRRTLLRSKAGEPVLLFPPDAWQGWT